jgi:hypothetical protein
VIRTWIGRADFIHDQAELLPIILQWEEKTKEGSEDVLNFHKKLQSFVTLASM